MTSYCRYCNTPLWREYRFNGLATVAEYYDTDVTKSVGRTDQWRITHCTGCGEQLREEIVSDSAPHGDAR
jgi:hypothetical protein